MQNVQVIIEKSVTKAMNAYVQNHKSVKSLFTSWDDSILKSWKGTVLPFKGSLQQAHRERIDRSLVKWKPPSLGYFILKFDGASRGTCVF